MARYKYIGERIARQMKQADLPKHVDLAKKSKVASMTVGRLLKGATNIELSTLENISEALDVPVCSLVCRNDLCSKIAAELHGLSHDDLAYLLRYIETFKSMKK